MKAIHSLFILAGTLLLSSCWHFGDRQRRVGDSYTGVDIFHPVDGKIYHAPGKDAQGRAYGYVVAPEISYKILGPAYHNPLSKPEPDWAEYRRPTGRVVVARIDRCGFCEIVPELPKGLRATEAPKHYVRIEEDSPHIVTYWRGNDDPLAGEVGMLSEQKGEIGTGRRLLAGTCDYVVDPLLDVATATVGTALAVVGLPIGFITYYTILNPLQQQQAVETPPAPTAAHKPGE